MTCTKYMYDKGGPVKGERFTGGGGGVTTEGAGLLKNEGGRLT